LGFSVCDPNGGSLSTDPKVSALPRESGPTHKLQIDDLRFLGDKSSAHLVDLGMSPLCETYPSVAGTYENAIWVSK